MAALKEYLQEEISLMDAAFWWVMALLAGLLLGVVTYGLFG